MKILVIINILLFITGVLAPAFTVEFDPRVNWLPGFETKTCSIMSGIWLLVSSGGTNTFIAIIIFVFSIVIPSAKLSAMFDVARTRCSEKYKLLLLLSKYSMTDVLVLSVLLIRLKNTPLTDMLFHYGFFIFTASVLLSMLLGAKLSKKE